MANKFEIGSLSKERALRIMNLEKRVQATTTKTKPVFFHKGGALKSFETVYNNYRFNGLELDLGCINQLGICE
jgi:uncharacterized protein involved in tellurium resistance